MAKKAKFSFKKVWNSIKMFFINLWSNFKKINWKELMNRTVKPAVSYSIVGGCAAIVLLIGLLVIL